MTWVQKLASLYQPERQERRPPPLPNQAKSWKHLNLRQMQGLRNLLFCARQIVEGAYSGRHRSLHKGASPEFVDYREYYPGDELRTIDWKVAARTDRLFVRLFEKTTEVNTYMVVDTSASMAYGGKPDTPFLDHKAISKLDYSLCLAATLAYLIIKQGDKAGLTLVSDRIHYHVPPGGTFAYLYGMLNHMERQRGSGRTHLAQALRDAFPLCRRKGLLIVFSDLLEEDGELFNSLNLYRHRGFEIVLFQVMNPDELTLPDEPSIVFIDAESGETINTHPREIAEGYRRQVQAWIEGIGRDARARHIDHHLLTTDVPYETVLNQYLLRRSRR
jgi:uncharacterized protein (DUF58 family)